MQPDKHQNGPGGRAEGWQKIDAKDDPEHSQILHAWTIGPGLISPPRATAALRQAEVRISCGVP
jgi:hypothetical protein